MDIQRLKQIVCNTIDKGLTLFCWAGALLLLWGSLQIFCFTTFKIPTDSMEPSLLAGDKIVVNKLIQGARLFDVFAALRNEGVTIYRTPSIGDLKRNDVLVFNFPYQEGRWDSIRLDVMQYYVKRCVALPGDTLEIKDGFFRIRGNAATVGNKLAQRRISMIQDYTSQGIVMSTFPRNETLNWTIKEFGPLPIPRRGQIVHLDSVTWLLYRQLIGWEQKKRLQKDGNRIILGDSVINQYRFKENYYFVAGDKAENSQDSRYWGMLPEPYIVGKATLIWNSIDRGTGKMKWNRVLKKIE